MTSEKAKKALIEKLVDAERIVYKYRISVMQAINFGDIQDIALVEEELDLLLEFFEGQLA